MSRSLAISCERVSQQADDPLEQRTWAAMRIYAGQRCVTRWLERESKQEADSIYIPAFPVARWVVMNWWALLNEPCPEESPPGPSAAWSARERAWLERHCLRSAESGLFLPRLSMWNDGRYFNAHWVPDPDDLYETMPGPFLYGSSDSLNIHEAEDALRSFVVTVLRWLEDVPESRADRLRANWQAITDADPQEAAFCKAAGRMGLDPYESSSWPIGLIDLLEALSPEDPDPILTDFLSAATAKNAVPLWDWVSHAQQVGKLGRAQEAPPLPLKLVGHAGQAGVAAARRLRQKLDIDDNRVLPDIQKIAEQCGLGRLVFQECNHLPEKAIRAAVGWRAGSGPVVLGPLPQSDEGQRFLEARGLFHAAFMCQRGARLITQTHDWDQQASRGFAAELLAPRAALTAEVTEDLDEDEVADAISVLAQKYHVHTELVRRQLQNATREAMDAP